MNHEETNIHPLATPHRANHYYDNDDEIDLRELLQTLFHYKYTILIITLVTLAIAVLYLLVTPKTYQAKAVVTASHPSKLSELSILTQPISHLIQNQNQHQNLNQTNHSSTNTYLLNLLNAETSRNNLLKDFKNTFSSRNNLYQFYKKEDLDRHYNSHLADKQLTELTRSSDRGFEKFTKAMIIEAPKKNMPQEYFTLKFDSHTQNHSENILKSYIKHTNNITTTNFSNALQQEIKREAETLKRKLQDQRNLINAKQSDRISQLDEAIKIARKLDLEFPSQNELGNLPLYQQGFAALEAEKQILQERTNSDAFTKNLRKIENDIASFEATQVKNQALQVTEFSDSPIALPTPTNPKTQLVLALAMVLGIFLGTIIALMRNMFSNTEQRHVYDQQNPTTEEITAFTQSTDSKSNIQAVH